MDDVFSCVTKSLVLLVLASIQINDDTCPEHISPLHTVDHHYPSGRNKDSTKNLDSSLQVDAPYVLSCMTEILRKFEHDYQLNKALDD